MLLLTSFASLGKRAIQRGTTERGPAVLAGCMKPRLRTFARIARSHQRKRPSVTTGRAPLWLRSSPCPFERLPALLAGNIAQVDSSEVGHAPGVSPAPAGVHLV